MSIYEPRFAYVSAWQRRRADRFLADLYGHPAPSSHYHVGEDYRNVDHRTLFQGNVDTVACPIALPGLFRLYAQVDAEIAMDVQGRTLRFTRSWTRSSEGTAVLRGRIRYEIARRKAQGAAERIRTALANATGDPERIAQLRTDFATPRPVDVSPILVEEATGPGVSWGCRGYRADGTIRISRNERGTGCPQTEAAIRANLQQRTDAQARRAIYEREHAATVNRRPPDERARVVADLLARGSINEGQRAEPRLRDRFARLHAAWDIPAIENTAVYTPLPGQVTEVGERDGYGNVVRVLHDTITTPVITNYCHLNTTLVVARQRVVAGLALGLAGNTGIDDMSVHLHFSVQQPGSRLSTTAEERRGIRAREWFRDVTGSDRPYGRLHRE